MFAAEPLLNKSSCPDKPVVEARSGRFASCGYQATGTLHSACHHSLVMIDGRGGTRCKTRPGGCIQSHIEKCALATAGVSAFPHCPTAGPQDAGVNRLHRDMLGFLSNESTKFRGDYRAAYREKSGR